MRINDKISNKKWMRFWNKHQKFSWKRYVQSTQKAALCVMIASVVVSMALAHESSSSEADSHISDVMMDGLYDEEGSTSHQPKHHDLALGSFDIGQMWQGLTGLITGDGSNPHGVSIQLADQTELTGHSKVCHSDGDQEIRVVSVEVTGEEPKTVFSLTLESPPRGCDTKELTVAAMSLDEVDRSRLMTLQEDTQHQQSEGNQMIGSSAQESQTDDRKVDEDKLTKNAHIDIPAEPVIQLKSVVKPNFFFPLGQVPLDIYTGEGRDFGAQRDHGRLHAGVDLLEYSGQSVHAITDGEILGYYYFYEGSYVIDIDHHQFIIRYGEVSNMTSFLNVGDQVEAGKSIGLVGLLYSGSSMLHLEKYTGKLTGPFYVGTAQPFQRRQDLINPTNFVKSLEGAWPSS